MAQSSSGFFEGIFYESPPVLLQSSIQKAGPDGQVAGKTLYYPQAVFEFYASRTDRPFWLEDGALGEKGKTFIQVLEKSWSHGLNPSHYHLKTLQTLSEKARSAQKAELELLLTDAFIRYGRDLSGIRVNIGEETEYWQKPAEPSKIVSELVDNRPLIRILHQIEPQGATYKRLQKELAALQQQPEEDYASLLPIRFDGVLMKPGWRHASVPALRARLGLMPRSNDTTLYDEALAASVMAFQQKNGLNSDGIIGSNTLRFLNQTKTYRMLQIIANLERLRWVAEDKPEKFVVVNIPSATLWAIDKGRVQFEMDVIVGKPVRQTNSFIAQITGMRFNPDWTVPPTIKRFDILPKLQEDPNYLQNKGIELISGYGSNAQTLDSTAIDWNTISRSELNGLRMVQTPGRQNPLGRFRVLMPNKYNIYLHDTNSPELFNSLARAASSGCVRMKEPEKMARFIMDDVPDWDHSDIQTILSTTRRQDFDIHKSIPIYMLYYTAWVDEKDRVVFGNDVYNKDSKLITLLENVDGFHIPSHNALNMARSGPSDIALAQ